MEGESRRRVLLAGARLLAVTGLGALAVGLGLRRRPPGAKDGGYCHRAGRCGGCDTTAACDVYRDMHGGGDDGR